MIFTLLQVWDQALTKIVVAIFLVFAISFAVVTFWFCPSMEVTS